MSEEQPKAEKEPAASRSIPFSCRSAASRVTGCRTRPGGALMCYASGVDEAEAVRETVAILKQADLAVLEVEGHGTLEEQRAAGAEIDARKRR